MTKKEAIQKIQAIIDCDLRELNKNAGEKLFEKKVFPRTPF